MFKRIRDLREDNNLSRREIAEMLHMSINGYAKYETGGNVPTEILIRLADFYGTSVDYLVGRTNERKKK